MNKLEATINKLHQCLSVLNVNASLVKLPEPTKIQRDLHLGYETGYDERIESVNQYKPEEFHTILSNLADVFSKQIVEYIKTTKTHFKKISFLQSVINQFENTDQLLIKTEEEDDNFFHKHTNIFLKLPDGSYNYSMFTDFFYYTKLQKSTIKYLIVETKKLRKMLDDTHEIELRESIIYPDYQQREIAPAVKKIILTPEVKLTDKNIDAKIDKLDRYQSALFFHYLKEIKIILPYEDTSLARLVYYLTGHSEQNLRTKGFAYIKRIKEDKEKNQNYKDTPNYNLTAINTVVKEILSMVDKDIETNNLKKVTSL